MLPAADGAGSTKLTYRQSGLAAHIALHPASVATVRFSGVAPPAWHEVQLWAGEKFQSP